jgi:putative tricarboxylic transport membrane protein
VVGGLAPTTMTSKLQYLLPHAALTLIAAILLWFAQGIHSSAVDAHRISPGFWPKAILWLWLLLAAGEFINRCIKLTRVRLGEKTAKTDLRREIGSDEQDEHEPGSLSRAVIGLAVILGYSIFVSWVGFPIATTAFLFAFAWLGGYRKLWPLTVISLIGTAVLILIFMKVAYISLPLGVSVFKDFSILILQLFGIQ